MKISRTISRYAVLALCAAGMLGAQSAPGMAADCYAVGQEIAAQNGGTLAKASESNQGGQTVCVIVVLVPGKEGQRPRRQEFVVPAN